MEKLRSFQEKKHTKIKSHWDDKFKGDRESQSKITVDLWECVGLLIVWGGGMVRWAGGSSSVFQRFLLHPRQGWGPGRNSPKKRKCARLDGTTWGGDVKKRLWTVGNSLVYCFSRGKGGVLKKTKVPHQRRKD